MSSKFSTRYNGSDLNAKDSVLNAADPLRKPGRKMSVSNGGAIWQYF